MSRRRIAARVEGLVQGVGFCRWVKRQADRLECDGWVRNEADGSVMLEAEGEAAHIASLEALVRRGPPGAWVRAAVVRDEPPVGGPPGFTIRTGHHTGD